MKNEFLDLAINSFKREVLKRLIFSRPRESEISKVAARLCAHRGKRILELEYSLPGNTVSQRLIPESDISDELSKLLSEYRQANLLTTLGDAEFKYSKRDKPVLLGADKLRAKLAGERATFETAIESLDRKKDHILSGGEDFLIKLGISDRSGRVHDKKQGKFRQINKFLEHIGAIYDKLPGDGEIKIFDLCCGKSYLSFAVYYYLTEKMQRKVYLYGIDLKRDVIEWCRATAAELGFSRMSFACDDVKNTPRDIQPDMVISLHACDLATDIVLNVAIKLRAKVILSTPCCHRYLNDKIHAEALSFVSSEPQLKTKLCESITDGLRLLRLRAAGYSALATELTDPENTPKNTLIRAYLKSEFRDEEREAREREYRDALSFILGDGAKDYLSEIN